MTETQTNPLDLRKIEIDVVKHLSTLNTASIVIMATLMDKIPKPVIDRRPILGSTVCLVTSLLFCVACLARPWLGRSEPTFRLSYTVALYSFMSGNGFLGYFTIVSL